ncbi:diversity-generating retroelement protein bAvd family protein [bacterium (Candidatus Howlettbacteria) CG_4_10_14_0_8_um_filter_40_9]|nr:MAG: diversity-generating retroelement protein bAvd family protein [bacterium (Candidatus Howlettbacteria) CG_4_10_14_0_8_um_filter_40_9]
MENFHDTPIIQKVYNLYRDFYITVEKMQKKDKYSLGLKIQNSILEILELTIEASNLKQAEKITPLEKASIKTDLLKTLIRLAHDIKAIDQKKYIKLEEQVQEIGKMIGGWLRYIK